MAIKTRIICALLALAVLGWTAPAAIAEDASTFTFYLHDNGRMDETAEAKPAFDPSTMVLSWNGSRVSYTAAPTTADLTLPAGDSVQMVLYREALMDNAYTTTVTARYRLDGVATPIASGTFGPVDVAGKGVAGERPDHAGAVAGALAAYGEASGAALDGTADACGALSGACDTAERLVPGLGTFLGSFYDVVVSPYVDLVLDAAVEESGEDELQDGWERLTLTLDADVTIPAGAAIELEWQTTYEGHPVDQVKHERFDAGEMARPDIITYVDREDTPSRVEFTLA